MIGTQEPVAARLLAARVPAKVVHARRRAARKHAKQKGYAPSQAHVTLLAWTLLITHVSKTIWPPSPVLTVEPIRWHVELMWKSWKSSLH